MGRIERKLNIQLIGQILAKGLRPHPISRNKLGDPRLHPPFMALPSKWPTPSYRKRRKMKAQRRAQGVTQS